MDAALSRDFHHPDALNRQWSKHPHILTKSKRHPAHAGLPISCGSANRASVSPEGARHGFSLPAVCSSRRQDMSSSAAPLRSTEGARSRRCRPRRSGDERSRHGVVLQPARRRIGRQARQGARQRRLFPMDARRAAGDAQRDLGRRLPHRLQDGGRGFLAARQPAGPLCRRPEDELHDRHRPEHRAAPTDAPALSQ